MTEEEIEFDSTKDYLSSSSQEIAMLTTTLKERLRDARGK
jgi:hypothetical protein